MGKRTKQLLKEVNKARELMFLHNTNAEKLARQQKMGGMPMPSMAVTKDTIPFEGFGDITLIGKPESFDPRATKMNEIFTADAYTVRAPHPVRKARKGAGKLFQEKYQDDIKALGGYTDEVNHNIWDLESKGSVNEHTYNQVVNYFGRGGDTDAMFLRDIGVEVKGDPTSRMNVSNTAFEHKDKRAAWAQEKIDELFEPEEYFVSNPNRDYYTQRARLKPYTAEEITKHMRKSAGAGGEGNAVKSVGGVRSATTEKLTSLKAVRDRKEKLVNPEEMAVFKDEMDSLFFDLAEAGKRHYQYSADGFRYLDEFSEFMRETESMGFDRAAKEFGFDFEFADDYKQELKDYMDLMRHGQTEYFEAKPKRVVELTEFGGAIVPEGTDKKTLALLEEAGIPYEFYGDEIDRVVKRKKFSDMAFGLAPAGAAGLLAGTTSEESQAGPLTAALKRAKDLGFDTDSVYYHGNGADVEEFIAPQQGRTMGGIYFTNDPKVANTYTKSQAEGGAVYPVYLNKQNVLEVWPEKEGHNWNDIDTNGLYIEYPDGTGDRAVDVWELEPNDFTTTDEIGMEARAAGYDGVVIHNVRDLGFNSYQSRHDLPEMSDTVIMFKPQKVRSVNARFNEGAVDSPNLLANVSGPLIGLGGAAAMGTAPQTAEASVPEPEPTYLDGVKQRGEQLLGAGNLLALLAGGFAEDAVAGIAGVGGTLLHGPEEGARQVEAVRGAIPDVPISPYGQDLLLNLYNGSQQLPEWLREAGSYYMDFPDYVGEHLGAYSPAAGAAANAGLSVFSP